MKRFSLLVLFVLAVAVPSHGQYRNGRCPAPRYVRVDTGRPVYHPVFTQPVQASPQAVAASPGNGFLSWINAERSRYGLRSVVLDANLSAWAAMNNAHQNARGMGHFVMGAARRQNSGWGPLSTVCSMWMQSPAHRSALLDPSITAVGIAGSGAYWTFNGS